MRKATTDSGKEIDKDPFSAFSSDRDNNGLKNTSTDENLPNRSNENAQDHNQSAQTGAQHPNQQQPENASSEPGDALQQLAKLREVIKPPRPGNTGEDAKVNVGGEEMTAKLREQFEEEQEYIEEEAAELDSATSGAQFALSAGIVHAGFVAAGTTLGLPPGITGGASTVMTLHDAFRFMQGSGSPTEANDEEFENLAAQLDKGYYITTELENKFAENRPENYNNFDESAIDPDNIEAIGKMLRESDITYSNPPLNATNTLTASVRHTAGASAGDERTREFEPSQQQMMELGGPEAPTIMPG